MFPMETKFNFSWTRKDNGEIEVQTAKTQTDNIIWTLRNILKYSI